MGDGEYRNWSVLPQELTSSILHRLGAIEILENAQKVCRSWRDVCRQPSMWQIIDMNDRGDIKSLDYDLEIMCRHAIDRSQGGLVDINIEDFGTDDLLQYIADNSSNLRRLRLAMVYPITVGGLVEAILKFPLLEDLEVSNWSLSEESLKVIGESCPNLKTLILTVKDPQYWNSSSDEFDEYDGDALAIAGSMHGLRHLQLLGNKLTDTGLNAILDNCPHLEHFDLRQCFNVKLVGNMENWCSERIKVVRRANDPITDDSLDETDIDIDWLEDEYPI